MHRSVEVRPGVVSVMLPVHNAEPYIGQAIESLLGQTHTGWELLVVDDGSTDGTAAIIKRYDDPRIDVHAQPNQGEAAARNRALQHLRGEWIAFLDADDIYLADHLQAAVGRLQSCPALGGAYSDGFYVDEGGHRGPRLSSRRRGPFEGDLFDQLVRSSDVIGPPVCAVLRRQIVLDHNLSFDTRIVIGPDWDFMIRFAAVAEFGYIDQPTCLYRLHPGSISASTTSQRRAMSLAQCRMNAIQHQRFGRCSLETRVYAFYDLLVELLQGDPRMQSEVIGWPQFVALPAAQQARLMRLMAARSLALAGHDSPALAWLRTAVELAPQDARSRILFRMCQVSPRLGQWAVRLRSGARRRMKTTPPKLETNPEQVSR